MIQQGSYIQFASIFIASVIGLFSMTYSILSRFYNQGFTFHFIGIRRPNNFSKSQYKLLDTIDTDPTMVTVKTSLKSSNTISDLKQIIKKTYSLPNTNDILIFYLNHIVSLYEESDQLTLQDFGITNDSLLTLAVCHSNKIDKENGKYTGIQRTIFPPKTPIQPTAEPVHSVNQLFDMFQDEEDEQYPDTETKEKPKGFLEPFIGFDVIMQQGGVLVYKMPNCGHEMNKESLYNYALNTFTDNNNIKLHCPHQNTHSNTPCKAEWDLNAILEVLRHKHCDSKIEHASLMKLELLSARNKVECGGCNVQKCPRCKTLYFKNKSDSNMKLDAIKTVYDIQNEFKTECVLCQPDIPQYLDIEKLRKVKPEYEIDMEKARAINAMFGMFQDEENEENEEIREIETGNAINEMFGMFEDEYDIDSDDENGNELERKYDENGYVILEATNSFCFCCGEEWIRGHICDNSFRRDLIEILEKTETKKIGKVEGVPSIRCC
eukprot:898960_1